MHPVALAQLRAVKAWNVLMASIPSGGPSKIVGAFNDAADQWTTLGVEAAGLQPPPAVAQAHMQWTHRVAVFAQGLRKVALIARRMAGKKPRAAQVAQFSKLYQALPKENKEMWAAAADLDASIHTELKRSDARMPQWWVDFYKSTHSGSTP